MRTSEYISYDGRVSDISVAQDMANIEKPYRETPLTLWQKIISSRTKEILIGIEKSERFAKDRYGIDKFRFTEEEIIESERKKEMERRFLEAKKRKEELRKAEGKMDIDHPAETAKLKLYEEYLKTSPSITKAFGIVWEYAEKANEKRDHVSYLLFRKSRRMFYEYFIDNRYGANEYLRLLLQLPTDWHSTEDDEWLLDKMRGYDARSGGFYGGYGYISIYRFGNKTGLMAGSREAGEFIKNKSLAARLILEYARHSGYSNMREGGTGEFINQTLWGYGLDGEDYKGLLACFPTCDIKDNHLLNRTYVSMIDNLIARQKEEYELTSSGYISKRDKIAKDKKERLEKEERERIEKIAKDKKEQEERIERERLEKIRELEEEKKRLRKQGELEKELFGQDS